MMVDLMNQIWSRGTYGTRGSSLFNITTAKINHVPCPWFSGRRSRHLTQVHLHIDDRTLVIPQKKGEQYGRDVLRNSNSGLEGVKVENVSELENLGFHKAVTVPWSSFMTCRKNRDSICSLHVFYAMIALMELAESEGLNITVFLYGECFGFPVEVVGCNVQDLIPEYAPLNEMCNNPRSWEVVITRKSRGSDTEGGNYWLYQEREY